MKLYLICFVLLCNTINVAKAQNDKHTLYFNRNSAELDLINHEELNHFIKLADSIAIDSITVHGYSDYLGRKDYNKALSQKRAQHVFDFLKTLNNQTLNPYLNENTTVLGKGEIYSPLTSPKGIPKHRKVEITLYQTPSKYTINNTRKVRVFEPEKGMKFNQVYVLEKVHFIGNEPELLKSSIPQLEDFYNQIKQIKTEFKLVIKGHICCLDEDATEDDKNFSRVLSTARALRIQDFLVKKGIPEEYIEYNGYSFDQPLIYPELTDNDRQTNRRVEAILYK